MQRSNSMLFANFNQDFTCVSIPFLEPCVQTFSLLDVSQLARVKVIVLQIVTPLAVSTL